MSAGDLEPGSPSGECTAVVALAAASDGAAGESASLDAASEMSAGNLEPGPPSSDATAVVALAAASDGAAGESASLDELVTTTQRCAA